MADLFFASGSALRLQLDEYSQAERPVVAFPNLVRELMCYALSPITTRRTEGVHAIISHVRHKARRMRTAWLAAALRRQDVEKALQELESRAFIHHQWRRRDVLRQGRA